VPFIRLHRPGFKSSGTGNFITRPHYKQTALQQLGFSIISRLHVSNTTS